eukprot:1158350-Pelagomonas_calceolata.AAC.1
MSCKGNVVRVCCGCKAFHAFRIFWPSPPCTISELNLIPILLAPVVACLQQKLHGPLQQGCVPFLSTIFYSPLV